MTAAELSVYGSFHRPRMRVCDNGLQKRRKRSDTIQFPLACQWVTEKNETI